MRKLYKIIPDPLNLIFYMIVVSILIRAGYVVYDLTRNEFITGNIFSLVNKIVFLSAAFFVAGASLYYVGEKDNGLLSKWIVKIFLVIYNILLCTIYYVVCSYLNQNQFTTENWICGISIVAVAFIVVFLLQLKESCPKNLLFIPRLIVIMWHFFMMAEKYITSIPSNWLQMFWGELGLLVFMIAGSFFFNSFED